MKIKFSIKKEIQLQPDIIEEKINKYLKKNSYRVTENVPGSIIFIDDRFSDRKTSKRDYYNRIEEGKFELQSKGESTIVKLVYLVPVLFEIIVITLIAASGAYFHNPGGILISFALTMSFGYKIYFLNKNVINDMLES